MNLTTSWNMALRSSFLKKRTVKADTHQLYLRCRDTNLYPSDPNKRFECALIIKTFRKGKERPNRRIIEISFDEYILLQKEPYFVLGVGDKNTEYWDFKPDLCQAVLQHRQKYPPKVADKPVITAPAATTTKASSPTRLLLDQPALLDDSEFKF